MSESSEKKERKDKDEVIITITASPNVPVRWIMSRPIDKATQLNIFTVIEEKLKMDLVVDAVIKALTKEAQNKIIPATGGQINKFSKDKN